MAAEIWMRQDRRRRLEAGHPWVFRSEIAQVRGDPETGDSVRVCNHQGHFLAQGFYHEASQIAVRIASYREAEELDAAWVRRTVAAAWSYRKRLLRRTDGCRAVFGEADGLPGLIVDRYGDTAVMQVLSAGMERRREWVIHALREVIGVRSVFERSEGRSRTLEGLAPRVGCVSGDCPGRVEILENGLLFLVDTAEGHKTGHFYDHAENRAVLAPYVRFAADERPRPDLHFAAGTPEPTGSPRRGADVLDAFCHTGGFSIHAAHYGAARVTGVDIAPEALAIARENAERNQCADRCEFVEGNVFDLLRQYEREGRRFDVVILDPPAFAKGRQAVAGALRGYRDINLRALRLIRDGGFLVSASCSSPVTWEMWRGVIAEAADDAHKILRLSEQRGAARDHPRLLGMPENDYLKFAVFEVRSRGAGS